LDLGWVEANLPGESAAENTPELLGMLIRSHQKRQRRARMKLEE
jgi:hypothetical protein